MMYLLFEPPPPHLRSAVATTAATTAPRSSPTTTTTSRSSLPASLARSVAAPSKLAARWRWRRLRLSPGHFAPPQPPPAKPGQLAPALQPPAPPRPARAGAAASSGGLDLHL
eukprot:SAG22_NODE_1155_length_5341_cov_12.348531_4_plen_112_part_00